MVLVVTDAQLLRPSMMDTSEGYIGLSCICILQGEGTDPPKYFFFLYASCCIDLQQLRRCGALSCSASSARAASARTPLDRHRQFGASRLGPLASASPIGLAPLDTRWCSTSPVLGRLMSAAEDAWRKATTSDCCSGARLLVWSGPWPLQSSAVLDLDRSCR